MFSISYIICSDSSRRHRALSTSLRLFERLISKANYTMFYVIGLGLCDEKDITVRGLEVGPYPPLLHFKNILPTLSRPENDRQSKALREFILKPTRAF